jgi:hypothetical protein
MLTYGDTREGMNRKSKTKGNQGNSMVKSMREFALVIKQFQYIISLRRQCILQGKNRRGLPR